MRARKVDANHGEVVAALRAVGCSVMDLSAVGQGCPDLLVSRAGKMWLVEVKDGKKPPSKQALTPEQEKWHKAWQAPVIIARSPQEAVEAIG